MTPRITKSAEERRAEILNVAQALIIANGYEQTTVAGIIDAIGVAKGTFYHHFRSKEEVMRAIVDRFNDEMAEQASAAAALDLAPPAKLAAVIQAMAAKPGEPRGDFVDQLHAAGAELHQRALTGGILRLTPILTRVVEEGIAAGHFATPYPRAVIEFLLAGTGLLLDGGFGLRPEDLAIDETSTMWIVATLLGTSIDAILQAAAAPEETPC